MAEQIIETPIAPRPGSQRVFGRVPIIDQRSKLPRFAMAAPKTERTFRNWLSPAWRDWPAVMDQGNTPHCVAYSATKFLLTHPIVNRPRQTTIALYNEAQKLDEWPGENYDGTSVNAGMKVLRKWGLVTSYTWAFEVEPVLRHILEIGPVCFGSDWTEGMFYPDRKEYIWPTGQMVGGHAYLLTCVNRNRINPDGTKGAVRILNSWGPQWGKKGRAWVTIDVLAKLLEGLSYWPGEAAAPIEADLPR